MPNKVLCVLEKPIYLSFEPVDPHLFATALGVADTPVEVNILLRDSGVNYGIKEQKVFGPKIGGQDLMQHDTNPGLVISFMIEHGAKVRVVAEDLKARGIAKEDLVAGVEVISEDDTVRLFEEHDGVIVW